MRSEFMPMVIELMVDLFTIEPVMGGSSKADQREHVLAVLSEPILDPANVKPEDYQQTRRALQRRLHDPALSDQAREKVISQLRTLKQNRRRNDDDQASS